MATIYYAQLGGSRILNASRVDQSGVDDADVADWHRDNDFILAICIHSGGKDTAAAQYKLRWRDVTDNGSFADVASTGEITYNATTNLVDGDAVIEAERKCSSQGDAWQDGEENEGDNLTDSIDLANDCETEIHFALSASGAGYNHRYEFELYDVTNGASKGTCGAGITIFPDVSYTGFIVPKPILGRQPRRGHPFSRGLVGLWLFNEGSGDKAYDLSGNGREGVISGATWSASKYGSGLDFVTDDYVTISNVPSVQQPFTIMGVAKFDTLTADRGFVAGVTDLTFMLWMDFATPCHFAIAVYDGGWQLRYGDIVPVVGQYYHLAIAYDGAGTYRLYVDGKQDGADLTATPDNNTNDIFLGMRITGQYHDGIIDHALMYNRALTDAEIAQLYREPFCIFEYDPIELWSAATGAAGEVLSANVSDSITVTESVTTQLPLLLADVSDSVTVNESVTPLMPLLLTTLFDSVGVTESITPLMPLLQTEISDSITVEESITPLMPLLEVSVYDEITVTESVTPSLGWIGISSDHYDSHCGDDDVHTVEGALDGTDYWRHVVDETHWLILDLGQIYNIQKVRGRSNDGWDPIDVNIYVSNDKENWGVAVATGISAWQDTIEWQEVDTTDKEGRYIKIEIADTENVDDYLLWGNIGPVTIFDVYGVPVALSASVSDSISVVEDVSTYMPLLIAEASDVITVAENIDTLLPLLIAEVSDSIAVTESIEATLPLYEVLEYDSVSVAEDVALENALLTASLYDTITVSEYVIIEEALPIISASVYDSIAVAELVTAYIFTMWTRVMGDNDVTWQNRPDSNSMTWQNRTDSNSITWRNP